MNKTKSCTTMGTNLDNYLLSKHISNRPNTNISGGIKYNVSLHTNGRLKIKHEVNIKHFFIESIVK